MEHTTSHSRRFSKEIMRLDGRRVRSDLTEAFKMINGYYDVTLDLFFLHSMTLEEEVIAKSC